MTTNAVQFSYQTQILEHHLDSFGHVNNAKYLELYEEARWDFITKNGYGLEEIVGRKQGPVILDVHCQFRREIVNRETITIESQSLDIRGKIMRIGQKILKENGELSSEAVFTCGFMDLKERKLIEPPQAWLDAVGAQK